MECARGQTRNPYKLDRSPNESSSGTRAAVAANLCVAGIGTETNGSIIDPASANCVVGVKPTVGLVGRGGVIPGVPSQDSVGPLARTVRDAAILLGTLVGVDERDPATGASRGRFHRDYTRFLDADGLRGARIGVPRNVYFGYDVHADAIAERAIGAMREAGATVVDPADIPTAEQLEDLPSSMVVQAYEFKRALNAYLAAGPGDHPRSLAELIEFNRAHADRELRYVRQDGLEAVQRLDFTEREYREALATNHRLSRAEGIDAVLRRHRLDALVMPTTGPPAKIDLIRGDTYGGGASTRRPRRLPRHQRPGGLRLRPAGRPDLHGHGVERADTAAAGVRVRAGEPGAPDADVSAGRRGVLRGGISRGGTRRF